MPPLLCSGARRWPLVPLVPTLRVGMQCGRSASGLAEPDGVCPINGGGTGHSPRPERLFGGRPLARAGRSEENVSDGANAPSGSLPEPLCPDRPVSISARPAIAAATCRASYSPRPGSMASRARASTDSSIVTHSTANVRHLPIACRRAAKGLFAFSKRSSACVWPSRAALPRGAPTLNVEGPAMGATTCRAIGSPATFPATDRREARLGPLRTRRELR